MIVEARRNIITLTGSITSNQWLTIKAAANVLLNDHPEGIIVDGSHISECSVEGGQTFLEAIKDIQAKHSRIVFCGVPAEVLNLIRQIPGIRSALPITETIEEAMDSLGLTKETLDILEEISRVCLIPFITRIENLESLKIGFKLALEKKLPIHFVYFLVIPRSLPLSTPMGEEEKAAHEVIEKLKRFALDFGFKATGHVERTRDIEFGIIETAKNVEARLIYLPVGSHHPGIASNFDRILSVVVDRVPCEVVVNTSKS